MHSVIHHFGKWGWPLHPKLQEAFEKYEKLVGDMEVSQIINKRKVTIINTLAVSPLIYLANVIYVPPQVITEIKEIIVDFLWDGKPPKIAYNVLIQNIKKGGVKLIDFGSKIKALKIGFVKRLSDNSSERWKSPAAHFYQTSNIKRYFQSNHAMSKEINHKFYSDIHNFWSELQTIDKPTHIVIQNQILWNNRYITIENVPYEWVSWQTNGKQYVNDILYENGDFLSHTEISEKFGVRCNFLQALQIRQSLPLEWRRVIRSEYSCKPVREPFIYQNHRPHSRQVTGACCTGGRGSPVMSWIFLKANNGPLDPGVGDKRFFHFKRNALYF